MFHVHVRIKLQINTNGIIITRVVGSGIFDPLWAFNKVVEGGVSIYNLLRQLIVVE